MVNGNYYKTKVVNEAVSIFQDKMTLDDALEIPPHILNPFLRILEIMKLECKIQLEFNFYESQENPKIYYLVRKGHSESTDCKLDDFIQRLSLGWQDLSQEDKDLIAKHIAGKKDKELFIYFMNKKESPFEVRDKVKCFWGSSDFDQEGIVIDPLVNYNNCMTFTEENCEPACIIRFNNTKAPNGAELGLNVVVPHRQIKKIE